MQWVKILTVSICILTILSQMIPQTKYEKYVRFYAGLIFLFIAAGPVLHLFSEETELSDMLKVEFLKEEYNNLEEKVNNLAEMKTEKIQDTFEKESSRQILMLASAYGFKGSKVNIQYGEDGFVQEIEVWLSGDEEDTELKRELKEIFDIDYVVIHRSGGRYENMD